MKNITRIFCSSFLIATVFFSPVVFSSYRENMREPFNFSSHEELAHELGRLISRCFSDTNRMITLNGNVAKKIAEKIHEAEVTTTMRILANSTSYEDYTMAIDNLQLIYNDESHFRFRRKAQGFLLAASSDEILKREILELKSSPNWKTAGLFIIINEDTVIDYGCKNAESLLWLAWQYNILYLIFLCHDHDDGKLKIYSYNPYNGMAPKSWTKVAQRSGRNGHPWILFKRNASEVESPDYCSEIFYDKTKTLDGYKIRVNVAHFEARLRIDRNKTGIEKYDGQEGKLWRCIFNFINASVEEIDNEDIGKFGYVVENGSYFGMLKDVHSGNVEIGLNGRYMVHFGDLEITNRFGSTNICFAIKSRGDIPTWINLIYAFDNWTNLGLILTIFLIAVFLSFHTNISDGCLNALKILTSGSTVSHFPPEHPGRHLIAYIYFFFIVMNGCFQGRFLSLLTKPRSYPNPETQQDLGDAGYTVIVHPTFQRFIEDPDLHAHVKLVDSPDCMNDLKGEDKIACTIDCGADAPGFKMDEYNVIPQKLMKFHLVFVASPEWPLTGKVNQIIRRLCDFGLTQYWGSEDLREYKKSERTRGERPPVLTLVDLAFTFELLLAGISIAFLVFAYEVISTWYRGLKSRGIRASNIFS